MWKFHEKLLVEFPPLSRADWESKLRQESPGEDFENSLVWKTLENIHVRPFYCAEDIENLRYLEQPPSVFPFVRGIKREKNTWEIRQDIDVDDVSAANKKAHFLIEAGTDGIGFDISRKEDFHFDEFRELTSNIDPTRVILHWIVQEDPVYIFDHYKRLAEILPANPKDFKGSVCVDPLGFLTITGGFKHSLDEDMRSAGDLISRTSEIFPGLKVIAINGQHFADAGVSCVQELGFSLAIAADYLSYFTNHGISAEQIANHMQLNLGIGSNYFFEIAKIRAARMLWSNLFMAYNEKTARGHAIRINSITCNWNKTIYDSQVNMLRLTTEAMSAIMGGCDSLVVRPFDSCFREAGYFSERLARNIQIILMEEAHLDKVVDPAAGAYYIESLTDALFKNAWQLFLETEEKGGYTEVFKSGFIQEEITANANKRAEMTATGNEIIVGTNTYPSFNEKVADFINPDITFFQHKDVYEPIAEPVRKSRGSVEFEKLRLAVEKHQKGQPKVFILSYGNLAMRIARAQFSSNFLAMAGYAIIDNPGFEILSEGVTEAIHSKADIIVACSSDEEYAETVPEIHRMINGKAILVVAGAPACMDELKRNGIVDFIHKDSNMIETFTYFHKKLGIAL